MSIVQYGNHMWLLSTRNVASVTEKLNFKCNLHHIAATLHSTDLYNAQHTRARGEQKLSEISITLLWMEQGKASNRFKAVLASAVGMHRVTADPSTLEACYSHSTKSPHPRNPKVQGRTVHRVQLVKMRLVPEAHH